jgi:hypothetical protein
MSQETLPDGKWPIICCSYGTDCSGNDDISIVTTTTTAAAATATTTKVKLRMKICMPIFVLHE